jgi:hypothetical protein
MGLTGKVDVASDGLPGPEHALMMRRATIARLARNATLVVSTEVCAYRSARVKR